MAIEDRARAYWRARQREAVGSRLLPSVLRMPVVPTRFGLAFLAVLAVMFVWSANHQLNLGYALTFLAFSVFLLGGTITAGQLAGLAFAAQGGAPVWAGDEASFTLTVVESDGRERGLVHVRNDEQRAVSDELRAGATALVVLRETTWQRGWHVMAPIEVFCTHPLGAFVTWAWLWLDARVLVYPRPAGDLPLPWQAAQILSYSPLASKAGALLPASATAAPPAGAGAPTVSWPTGARRDACNSLSMVMLSSSPPQKKKGRMRNTGIKSAAIVMMILVFCGMSVCAMMMLHFRKFFRNLRCKLSQMRPDGASICAVYHVHFAAFARGYF